MAAVQCALSIAQNHKTTKTRWKQTVTKYKWETITISGEGEGSVHYIQ